MPSRSARVLLLLMLSLATLSGSTSRARADERPATRGAPEFPISVEVRDALPGKPIRLVIRNTTAAAARFQVQMPLQAFVLRDVRWSDAAAGSRAWLHPLKGQVRVRNDGTVDHLLLASGETTLQFEEGLLPPGRALDVDVPRPPKGGPSHDLVVDYAVVAPGRDFFDEILLPKPISPKSPGDVQRYVPASQPALEAFHPGDAALVRSTRDGRPLKTLTKTFTGLLKEPVH